MAVLCCWGLAGGALAQTRQLEGVVAIVDESGREVPRGTEGDIAYRGPSHMVGYLGDAAETERDACCDDRSRSLHAGRMHGADECARAIRARGAGGGE